MRRITLLILVLILALAMVTACGSSDGESGPADSGGASDTAVADSGIGFDVEDVAGTSGSPDTGHDAALCDEVWSRLESCGHVYTYPNFRQDCEGWLTAGDADRLDQLELCAVYACARLVECVGDL